MRTGGRHSIGRVVMVMVVVVIIGVVIAWTYYSNANRSVDPRIVHARELYSQYDSYAQTGDYYAIFTLLDSVEHIYNSTAHYRGSFELGVLNNNRAAAFLTIALYRDSIPLAADPLPELTTDSMVILAETLVNKAINTYELWMAKFDGKSGSQIREYIESEFLQGLNLSDLKLKEKYLDSRVKEIESALQEHNRRLSVCYTNLGLVYRYKGNYKEAVVQYNKALVLWDRNLDAENNLNKLLNRPIKKRNIIQKMFPPKRDEG